MVYRVGVRHLGQFLGEVDIFQGLTERQLDRVGALCEERQFKAGDLIGEQDKLGSDLYVIRRGEIIVTTGSSDVDVVVRTVKEREAFPVAVLFEPPYLVTTTKAATDGVALAIPRVRLMELCELEPQIGLHIYKAACGIVMNRYRYTLHMLADQINPAVHIGKSWGGAEI